VTHIRGIKETYSSYDFHSENVGREGGNERGEGEMRGGKREGRGEATAKFKGV